jgi:hypothetical protein
MSGLRGARRAGAMLCKAGAMWYGFFAATVRIQRDGRATAGSARMA